MATKKAAAARKRSSKTRRYYSGDPGYVRLRTILDSLEIGALRFYLNDTTAGEKKQRLEKLEYELLPIIRQVWGSDENLIDCPPGYTNCDDCCVPYVCPQ